MNLVAPAVVSRYGKGTDSDATDAMVVTDTLRANGAGGGRYDKQPLTVADAHVRRLTPTECERLQGLPDGWTLEHGPSLADEPNFPHRIDESCPQPDSRRYAACGDAVTANVAEWIGRRL